MGKKVVFGIGEFGVSIVDALSFKCLNKRDDVVCFAVDTDKACLDKTENSITVPMFSDKLLGSLVGDDDLKKLSKWVPIDVLDFNVNNVKSLYANNGANLWRVKALMLFWAFMEDKEKRAEFLTNLENTIKDADGDVSFYVVASISGGTGSGLLLPFTLFIQKYIKEKFAKDVQAKLCIITNDVLSGVLSGEQGVKASANAYATIRELNAVNLLFDGIKNQDDSYPITVKIGDIKDKNIGLLIDSNDKEALLTSKAPFSKIYSFERIPGINSISIHKNYFTDLLSLILDDDSEVTDKPKYHKLIAVNVNYPEKTLIDYTVQKHIDDLFEEWLLIHKNVCGSSNKNHGAYSGEEKSQIEKYAQAYLSYVDYLKDEKEDSPLHKNGLDGYEKDSYGEVVYGLEKLIDDYLDIPESTSVKKAITKLARQYKSKKISVFKKKKVLNSIKDQLVKELKDYVLEVYNAIINKTEGFKQALSIEKKYLTDENGKKVNPPKAAFNLSILVSYLSDASTIDVLDASTCKAVLDLDNDEFDEWFDELYENVEKDVDGGYQDNSLIDILAENCDGEKNKIEVYSADSKVKELLVIASTLFAKLNERLYNVFIDVAKKEYSKTLEVYYKYFNLLSRDKTNVEKDLISYKNTGNLQRRTLYNVFSTPNEKEYTDKVYSDKAKYIAQDCIFNYTDSVDVTFDYLIGNPNDYQSFEDYKAKLFDKVFVRVKDSDFYTAKNSVGIVEHLIRDDVSLCSSSAINDADKKVEIAVSTAKMPSNYHLLAGQDSKHVTQKLTFSFSNLVDESLAQRVIGKYYQGSKTVKFLPTIDKDSLFVMGETGNLDSFNLDFVDEASSGQTGYVNSLKALRIMREQGSDLWNPYILKEYDRELPYINPVVQKDETAKIVKAFFYGVSCGKIVCISTVEEGKVYALHENDRDYPLSLQGEPIKYGKLNKLIFWLKDNDYIDKWCKEFDRLQDKLTVSLIKRSTGKDAKWLIDAILNNGLVSVMKDHLLKIAYQLKFDYGYGYYSNRLLELFDKVLKDLVSKFVQREESLYSTIIKTTKTASYTEFSKNMTKKQKETKDEVFAWLSSFGF